jgi:capsular exopolysaccharide synthesis family protein
MNANNQQKLKPQVQSAAFDNNDSFDWMLWVIRIARFWYLFVIAFVIALGLAYIKNRSWKPVYATGAEVMIEAGNTGGGRQLGAQAVMQSFNVDRGFQNVSNQLILFGSRTMVERAVKRLPLDVSYYVRGRFKTNSLYKISPVEILIDSIANRAYYAEFNMIGINSESFKITAGEEGENQFSITGEYGKPVICPLFSVIVEKTDNFKPKFDILFRFNTTEGLINQYVGRLAFNFVGDRSTVVRVSTQGEVLQQDIDFLNALCEEFIQDNLTRKNDAATRTIDFINAQLMSISDSLSISEQELNTFRSSNRIASMSAYSSGLVEQMGTFDQQRSELNLRSSYLTYLTDYLASGVDRGGAIVPPSGVGVENTTLMQVIDRMNDLQAKRSEVGEKSPYYNRYTGQIEAVKASLMEVLRNMQVEFNIEKRAFETRYAQTQSALSNLPEKESLMLNFERRHRINDSYYTYLLQKRAESQIQKASNSSDNVILDTARNLGTTNAGEKRSTYTSYISIALLLVLAFIVARELLNTTLRNVDELRKISPFEMLGVIRKAKVSDPVLVLKNPKSVFTESFRAIRTKLEFITKRKAGISLLVTSTEPGDGKSYVSLNLAGIYAMTGKKVILVDVDLRKPSVSSTLSLTKSHGVSNYLAGQASIDDIIIRDTEYKFDIILAGTLPPNPGELVRSDELKQLFEELKKNYDYVIVDTCPIGLVADAYSIAPEVDATIYVVRAEKTNKAFFKTTIEQVQESGLQDVYVVFNDLDYDKAEYNRNYGYGYGYGKNSYYMRREGYYTDDYFTGQ